MIEGHLQAADVAFRFDYKRTEDGTTINPGTIFRLAATDWLIDHSPYSDADLMKEPGAVVPEPDRLDYALVRLDGSPGTLPVNHPKAEDGAPARGFIRVPDTPVILPTAAPILIAQHPEGLPMKLAIDTAGVVGFNPNRTRIRYRTNTEGGSSGSPCFDIHWNLVALHHSGDPKADPPSLARHNQGIPIDAILRQVRDRGHGRVFE